MTYERGASAAVIAAVSDASTAEAGEAHAPAGMEFILSQLFCMVKGNEVLWSSHNSTVRDSKVDYILKCLIENFAKISEKFQFFLQPIVDRDVFKKVFDQGTSETDLGVGDFKPALEFIINKERGVVSSPFQAMFRRDFTPEQIEAASDLSGKLFLRPGRKWGKPMVKDLLSSMALGVFDEHSDEFKIVTKSGVIPGVIENPNLMA